MDIKLKRSYRSKNGNTVFVYDVTADAKQKAELKTAEGDFYREDEETGKPLWFTTRCVGNRGKLVITSKGKVVPDMSAFEQAASLAKQYGGNFGAELAKASVAGLLGHTPSAEAPTEE